MFIIELPNPSEFSALLPLPLPHLRLVKIQSTVHQTEAHMHSVWVRASISPPLFCFVNKMDYNRIYYNGLHVKLRVFIGSDLYQLGHEIKYTFHCVLWWRVWKQWSTLVLLNLQPLDTGARSFVPGLQWDTYWNWEEAFTSFCSNLTLPVFKVLISGFVPLKGVDQFGCWTCMMRDIYFELFTVKKHYLRIFLYVRFTAWWREWIVSG